ncbi:MAG: Crp/Fnr family transcriptional regulator [Bacteroidetes bacterium]|nr:Crp/Fnr family transcriptional regulator [Bacteroidota bacterium]MBS1641159.1 Crp/Fnr family transcriptional regulator [Bacteroidota bacterium]MBS1670829.1 Crp/Fnr family transcriptional regulator [Bacteroidota bacterium]
MAINGDNCLTCKVRNCSILKPCTVTTLSAISTFKTSQKFKKGEYLFEQGSLNKGVFFIKKGVVKVEIKSAGGRSFIVKIGGRGGIVGHRGSDNKSIQNYTVTALSEVICCFISTTLFKKILQGAADLEKQLSEEYLNDLKLMELRSLSLAYKTVREKIAEIILLIADLYNYTSKQKSFSIDLTRQDFADLSGTTKEQVSAALKDFERNELIKYSGKKFNFINIQALKAIANV